MMERLIAILFVSREFAHRRHLAVTGPGSFAAHSALGSFYDDIIDKADTIAEAYQGRYHIISDVPILGDEGEQEDIAECLQSHLDDLEKLRYMCCDKEDTTLQNLIDAALELYLSTLYKLRNLK